MLLYGHIMIWVIYTFLIFLIMESQSDDQALNWPKNWLVLNVWSVKRRVENTLLSVNSDAESSHPTTNHTTTMTIALLFINKRFALNEMFQQNVPKFDLYIAFFFFYFVQLYSSLMNVGAHVFIDPCILREIKNGMNEMNEIKNEKKLWFFLYIK